MLSKSFLWAAGLVFSLAGSAWTGTFGKVVAIGGEASDVALDESRGVLYIANFTANRIERHVARQLLHPDLDQRRAAAEFHGAIARQPLSGDHPFRQFLRTQSARQRVDRH